MPGSRQASSNASEGGNYNRESSLDDSGVVDDHYDLDTTGADLLNTSNVEVCKHFRSHDSGGQSLSRCG